MANAKPIAKFKKELSPIAIKMGILMEKRGFTSNRDLERAAGVPEGIVRKIRGGFVQKPNAINMSKIAKALGVSIDEFTGLSVDQLDISSPVNVAAKAIRPQWFQIGDDEMWPTFKSGDFIMIDFGVNEIAGSGVYAVQTEDSFVIRRLSVNPFNEMVVMSRDNEKYSLEGEFKKQHIQISGKVIGHYTSI